MVMNTEGTWYNVDERLRHVIHWYDGDEQLRLVEHFGILVMNTWD